MGKAQSCRVVTLTFSACYSSCVVKGTESETGYEMWTWTSRRMLMMRMRTCAGTCHMTHSWSGRSCYGNILSGTWEEGETQLSAKPPRAQHHKAQDNKKPFVLPKEPSKTHPRGELAYGKLCPSLAGQ